MNSQEMPKPHLTSVIVWSALNFSLVVYGFVLFQLGKINFISLPETYTPIEILALCMGLMLVLTLWIHEKKVKPETDVNKRFSLFVICLALNECMAVIAFAAVVMSESGNGFVYVMNFILAITGNLIMFPKEVSKRV